MFNLRGESGHILLHSSKLLAAKVACSIFHSDEDTAQNSRLLHHQKKAHEERRGCIIVLLVCASPYRVLSNILQCRSLSSCGRPSCASDFAPATVFSEPKAGRLTPLEFLFIFGIDAGSSERRRLASLAVDICEAVEEAELMLLPLLASSSGVSETSKLDDDALLYALSFLNCIVSSGVNNPSADVMDCRLDVMLALL